MFLTFNVSLVFLPSQTVHARDAYENDPTKVTLE